MQLIILFESFLRQILWFVCLSSVIARVNGSSFILGDTISVEAKNDEYLVGNSFVQDHTDDSFYIAGLLLDSAQGFTSQGLLTKIYKNGTRQWSHIFGMTGVNVNSVSKVLLDPGTADIFIAGSVYSFDLSANQTQLGNKDGFVARFSSNGTRIYANLLGSAGYDSANDITFGRDGQSLVIAGCYDSTQAFYIVSKDNGTLINLKSFPGYYGELKSLVIASDDRAFVTGSVGASGAFRVFLARFSTSSYTYTWLYYLASYSGSGYSVRYSYAADQMFITGISNDGYGVITSVSGSGTIKYVEWFSVPVWHLNVYEGAVGRKLLASANFQQTLFEMDFDTNVLNIYDNPSVQNWIHYLDVSGDRTSGYGLGRYPASLVKVNLNIPQPSATTVTLTISPTQLVNTFSNNTIGGNNTIGSAANITNNTTPMTPSETPILPLLPREPMFTGNAADPASLQNVLMYAWLAGMILIIIVVSIMINLHRRWIMRAKVHDESETRRISRTYETNIENDDYQMTTLSVVSNSSRRYVSGIDFITGNMFVLGSRVRVAKAVHEELKLHGESIVAKSFVARDAKGTQNLFKQLQHELLILQQLDGCPFTVKLLGFCGSPNPCLLFKYYTAGNLQQLIENHHLRKSKRLVFKLIKDIADGLNILHGRDIAHAALCLDNILLDIDEAGDPCCVISNFSNAQTRTQKLNNNLPHALPAIAAPEVLGRQNLDFDALKRADIFSFSHLVFMILTRKIIE